MHQFFIKKARAIGLPFIIDVGLLAMTGYFFGKRQLQMRWEKKALEEKHPGMKITAIPCSTLFGAGHSWAVEKKQERLSVIETKQKIESLERAQPRK